jgi:hypothetical protein
LDTPKGDNKTSTYIKYSLTMFQPLFFFSLCIVFCQFSIAQELVFNGGHAHNDYHNVNPLTDALHRGMVSIEADVFFKDGELLVGHSEQELSEGKTLKQLYLQPLFDYYNQLDSNKRSIILMIDIKNEPEACYAELRKECKPYHNMLSHYANGKIIKQSVTVVLSGNQPLQSIKKDTQRYAFLDGQFADLDQNISNQLMPLISDDWQAYFNWNGAGTIPDDEYVKLTDWVHKCHAEGKMIRFWGIPGAGDLASNFWQLFHTVGVDLIGTDDTYEFQKFQSIQKN